MHPEALPGHLIRRADVAAWLAESVVKDVTFHRTTVEAARAIRERGVRIDASRVGTFGQGFYTATTTDAFFGDGEVAVAVAVDLRRPLVGHADDIGDEVDALAARLRPSDPRITWDLAVRIRRELVAIGYDGIVAFDAGGDGIDYVVALIDGVTRVVIDP